MDYLDQYPKLKMKYEGKLDPDEHDWAAYKERKY